MVHYYSHSKPLSRQPGNVLRASLLEGCSSLLVTGQVVEVFEEGEKKKKQFRVGTTQILNYIHSPRFLSVFST